MDNNTFRKLKDNEKAFKVKQTLLTEDSIKVVDPSTKNYIKINGKKIEDIIKENVEKMLSLTGEIDPASVVQRDIVDLNLLSLYDNNNNVINYELEGVKKGSDYWDKETNKYIKILKDKLKEDISSYGKDELAELIKKHNQEYLNVYIAGIKANALDLANEKTRIGYANRLADTLADLQIQEINKIGVSKFLKTDLKRKPYKFIYYIDVKDLEYAQKNTIQTAKDIDKYYKELETKENAKIEWHNTKLERDTRLLFSDIKSIVLAEQRQKVQKIYEDSKEFYDKRYKKRAEIDKLLEKIRDKYQEQNDYLSTPRYRALDTTKDVLNEMQQQNKNIDNLSLTTTLVNNKIFNQTLKSGEIVKVPINYTDKNTKLQQTNNVFITLNRPDKMDITLTPAHKVINDRVGTLLDYGVQKITARQLYNFINKGEPSNDYVDNDKLKELNDTLNSMAIWGDLDASEQFNNAIYKSRLLQYNKKGNTKGSAILHQQLINFKYLELKLPNGDIMYYYVFLDKPLFYQYAQQLQQIAVVPAEIYNINDIPKKYKDSKGKDKIKKGYKYKVQITDITSTIRDNLINDIELRKSKKNTNININNFLNECNFTDLDKKARVNRLNNIEIILNNWIIKDYIKGYAINSNGRVKKYSISIFLTAEELNKARKDIDIASNIIDIKKFI